MCRTTGGAWIQTHFEDNECIIYDKGQEKLERSILKTIRIEKNISFPIIFKYAKDASLRLEVVDESWL